MFFDGIHFQQYASADVETINIKFTFISDFLLIVGLDTLEVHELLDQRALLNQWTSFESCSLRILLTP
jgi:hypothetical protein